MIKQAVEEGLTATRMAAMFRCTRCRIMQEMSDLGLQTKAASLDLTDERYERLETLRVAAQEYVTAKQLGEQFGIDAETVRTDLRYLKMRPKRDRRIEGQNDNATRQVTDTQAQIIAEMRAQNASSHAISETLGISISAVRQHGRGKATNFRREISREECLKINARGITTSDYARETGVNVDRLRRAFHKYGVPLPGNGVMQVTKPPKAYKFSEEHRAKLGAAKRGRTGPAANNWKGGHQTAGYRVTKSRSYEHRAVAETILDRPLLSHEQVHHVNQMRDDNRPENLIVLHRAAHTALHQNITSFDLDQQLAWLKENGHAFVYLGGMHCNHEMRNAA